jgi:hypothetical protein
MSIFHILVSMYRGGYPTSAEAWECWRHLPRPGEASCSHPAVRLLRVRACVQVTSCVLLKVRVYLSCWACWSDFPTGGGAPGFFCLAASMSTPRHPARHLQ